MVKDSPINNNQRSISICFQEDVINFLFSELLNARGVQTTIVETLEDLPPQSKIITEPIYFDELPGGFPTRCLLVGNKDCLKDRQAITLSRPLTEEKIEEALSRFLSL